MRKIWMVLGVVAVLALASCSSDGSDGAGKDASTTTAADDGGNAGKPADTAPTTEDLDGQSFTASEVTGHDLVAGSELRLAFDGDSMSANAGCNQSTGGYVIEDGTLRWDGPAAATQMACPDELMAQDVWLTDLLTEGAEATLDGDALTLTAGDVTIALAAEALASDEPLVRSAWTLESTVAGDTVASLPADVDAPTLEFADDGTVAVFAGCNRGSGAFVLAADGASATVGPIATTKMACEGAAAELESTVLGVLDGEVTVAVDGEQLTLTKGDAGLVYRAS